MRHRAPHSPTEPPYLSPQMENCTAPSSPSPPPIPPNPKTRTLQDESPTPTNVTEPKRKLSSQGSPTLHFTALSQVTLLQGSIPNGSTPSTLQNKWPARAASQSKQLSTCSLAAHFTPPRAASTSLPTAAPAHSRSSSPNRSMFKRCFAFWKRLVPALNRGRGGNRDEAKRYLDFGDALAPYTHIPDHPYL